jgi:hypothetical protein
MRTKTETNKHGGGVGACHGDGVSAKF